MKQNLIIGALLATALTVTATAASAPDGKALYEQHCAKCHGVDAKGNSKMGQKLGVKDYSNAKAWEKLSDAAALKAVKEGVKDKEGKMVMKPNEGLSEAEAKAVVDYMKTLKK